ncbi:MAG: 2-C-methyl-D-erythritol 4-phosphate cytidylyltransferase [Nitrosomonas sp.]|nr:2-C-methyl-D-erythritol 4-phosphate cytidylyltransferase [Nitrosomonas sp.]
MSKFFALIPAAGSGSRIGEGLPKQYLALAGKPMIYHAIHTLCGAPHISHVLVVLSPEDNNWSQYNWSEFSEKLLVLNCGGATRAESVLNGLQGIKQLLTINDNDWILVHDAARPCLTPEQLENLINELSNDAIGGLLAIPVADTLKRSDTSKRAKNTESRENLWQAQTPQMFRYRLLVSALSGADRTCLTDDASAVETLGFRPKLVLGNTNNFKVTYPQDLALAELILQKREIL